MAIYDWPNTRAMLPQEAELRVIDNTQRVLESPLSGYVQTLSMPGARWGYGLSWSPQSVADRGVVEAYLLRLSGREHRARLWDLKRPRPRGDIVLGGVTLGAAAAQFGTTLQLAGCRGANAILGGSFESDASGDGVADGWTRYSQGSTGTLTDSLYIVATDHGTARQSMGATALGATAADRHGVQQAAVYVAHLAGRQATLACSVAATAGTGLVLVAEWLDSIGGSISSTTASATASGGTQTLSATAVVPAGAVTAAVTMYQHSGTGALAQMHIDVVRLVAGASAGTYPTPATLLAGDWLGLAGGQLVRVVADATADDLGRMTVEVRHMLRAAVASGSAVTLDRPTALYVRTESGIALPRQPGGVEPGMSAEFVEVFA